MKKTSNKGFSMVELIIVIAIMAILAAALAPALIKYINKSRLSTDISTGTSIASAASAAMAVEKANDDAVNWAGATQNVTSLINNAGDEFQKEFTNVLGVDSVKGKSKKDLGGSQFGAQDFYILIDSGSDNVTVWYGASDDDHMVSPSTGSSMAE